MRILDGARKTPWLFLAYIATSCNPEASQPNFASAASSEPRTSPTGPRSLPVSCGAAAYIPGGLVNAPLEEHNGQRGLLSVEPFCIDRTEVTCAEYQACITAGKCARVKVPRQTIPGSLGDESPDTPSCDRVCSSPDRAEHPMVCVTYDESEDFCEFRNGRLPFEPEWFLAARGVVGFDPVTVEFGVKFPTPFDPDTSWDVLGLARPHMMKDTRRVGTDPRDRSDFGAYDMFSNVNEWSGSRTGLYRTVENPLAPSPVAPVLGDIPRMSRHGTAYDSTGRRNNRRGFRCAYNPGTDVVVVKGELPNDNGR
jgi:formylglycine-generating enzyme required for sulfatase activity